MVYYKNTRRCRAWKPQSLAGRRYVGVRNSCRLNAHYMHLLSECAESHSECNLGIELEIFAHFVECVVVNQVVAVFDGAVVGVELGLSFKLNA